MVIKHYWAEDVKTINEDAETRLWQKKGWGATLQVQGKCWRDRKNQAHIG